MTQQEVIRELLATAAILSRAEIEYPDDYYGIPRTSPASVFIGRWFMSKKPRSANLYRDLAKAYPFSGTAYRVDGYPPHAGKYGSWSGSRKGIEKWKDIQGISDEAIIYSGKISKGFDFTKFVKGEGLEGDYGAKLIMKVDEVVPIVNVTNLKIVN